MTTSSSHRSGHGNSSIPRLFIVLSGAFAVLAFLLVCGDDKEASQPYIVTDVESSRIQWIVPVTMLVLGEGK